MGWPSSGVCVVVLRPYYFICLFLIGGCIVPAQVAVVRSMVLNVACARVVVRGVLSVCRNMACWGSCQQRGQCPGCVRRQYVRPAC